MTESDGKRSLLSRAVGKLKRELEGRRVRQQERLAWSQLRAVGGADAERALRAGLSAAEDYRHWDAWSLSIEGIIWAAELIIRERLGRVMEFGAGYSTIALAHFLARCASDVHLDSFEHQRHYADLLQARVAAAGSLATVHLAPLIKLTDLDFNRAFEASDPIEFFLKSGMPISAADETDTRVRNAFYQFDFRTIPERSVGLVILDGPNGNGRSIAYPLLRRALTERALILIDDYLDYPFVDDLKGVYKAGRERSVELAGKEFALYRAEPMDAVAAQPAADKLQ